MAGRGWRQVHYVSLAFTPFGPTNLRIKERREGCPPLKTNTIQSMNQKQMRMG